MSLWELLVTAAALSMDALAVSICKGLSVQKLKPRYALAAGVYFGSFQALMPLAGFFLGYGFRDIIAGIDHWIAFVLLSFIGANMIKESLSDDADKLDCSFGAKAMLPLAVATSIDALAVGVTFAFLKVDIVPAVLSIGIVTFLFSAIGVYLGNVFGTKYKSKAELAGGVVLILIGAKILLEHINLI